MVPNKVEAKEKSVKKEVKAEATEPPVKAKKKASTTDEMIAAIKNMTVLELADLVKALEDKFGVSAQAPMAMMAPGAGAGGLHDRHRDG